MSELKKHFKILLLYNFFFHIEFAKFAIKMSIEWRIESDDFASNRHGQAFMPFELSLV